MYQIAALTALIAYVSDQLSKWVIMDVVNLPEVYRIPVLPIFTFQWVENRGVSFGMFQAGSEVGRWALITTTLLIVGLLVVMLKSAHHKISAYAYGMIIGGALGNIYDRVVMGYVADFLQFHVGDWSFAVFNVADIFITVGAMLLIYEAFFIKEGGDEQDAAK